MKHITRKRALELAIDALKRTMQPHAVAANIYARDQENAPEFAKRGADHYAEYAAALAYIETLARQKELL
jgi:hypothetical protein